MKRFLVLVLAGSVLTSRCGYGQDETPPDPAEELRQAARLSLAQGVALLKQKAAADPDGWIMGPSRYVKVIGTTNVTVHLSRRTVWQPIYSYTSVVTFVQETVGAPLRKVIQQRPVKQIGSNAVEQLVYDPNGSITREESRPIYDRSGNIRWTTRGIGDAALATYALRKAGVPDTDPVMQGMLINLRNHITSFGLPDQTWNLAWLTAVFAGTPGDQAAELTQRLASRLLDGQITDGDARGLWGTLSVHHATLAAMMRDYLAMLADLQKKEARLKEKPGKMAQAAVDEVQEMMDRHRTLTEAEVCQRAFRFAGVEGSWVIDPHADPQIMLPGADHLFFNQTVADIESTWVALFGLSVAAENGRLPAESRRVRIARKPGSTAAPSPLPPPERAEAVWARAANSLAARQAKDGSWSECNIHQPVTKFDAFKTTLPVPSDPKSFLPLVSLTTALSAAQGFAALDCIGAGVGMKKLLTSFGPVYASGGTASQKEIASRLAIVWPTPTVRPKFTREDYDLLLVLSRPATGMAEAGLAAPDQEKLVRALVLAGNPTGSWGKALYAWTVPSSQRARYDVFKTARRELTEAHIANVNAVFMDYSPLARDAEGVSTATAVLFLAGCVENPGAAVQELADLPDLADQRKEAIQRLLVKKTPPPAPKPAPVAAPPAASSAPAVPPAAGAPAPAATTAPAKAAAPAAPTADNDVPDLPAAPVDTKPKADEKL